MTPQPSSRSPALSPAGRGIRRAAPSASIGIPQQIGGPILTLVFITSRIYGGYANGHLEHGCLMPEPFAYEEGFAVQRMIVAQIQQANGGGPAKYAETVSYNVAPWFDWGPYIWASGPSISPATGLYWCNGQGGNPCFTERDFRDGDLDPGYEAYWGDFTHPSADGGKKVADQLVTFIGKTPNKQGSPWVTPWIQK